MKMIDLNNPFQPRRAFRSGWFKFCLAALTVPAAAFGTPTNTWNGASSTGANWSDAANWGGTAVASGNVLYFSGSTRTTNTNDVSGLSLAGVTLTNSLWTIRGNAVTLSGGTFAASVAGTSTWALDSALSSTPSFTQVAGTDILNLAGVLSGSGGITKSAGSAGQGMVFLSNTNNSFTGQVNIRSGIVQFSSLAPGGQNSSLGSGSGSILVGYTGTSYAGSLVYAGTNNGATDRALAFANLTTSSVNFSNNSPNNSSLTFDSTVPVAMTDGTTGMVFPLTLAGTSTGTNLFTTQFGASLWGGSLQIAGPGTWAFSNVFNFTGTMNVATNSHVVLLYNASLGDPRSDVPGFSQISFSPGSTLDVSSFDTNASTYTLANYGGYPQILVAGRTNTPATDINGSLSLAGAGGATLNVAGSSIPGTLTISSNFIPASGTIKMDLSTNTTVGSAVNDLILVGGNLDLSQGNTLIAVNAFKGAVKTNTPYTIISYTGTLTGDASGLSVPAPSRTLNPGVVSTAVPGLVQVTFYPSGQTNANLVWSGYSGPNWDLDTTLNWLNGGSGDYFFNADNVTFNDSASQTAVNLVGPLVPGSMVVSNSVNPYVFATTGSGYIGGGSLLKQGTAELQINTANSYSGGTTVSAGTVSAGNGMALGSGPVTLGDANTGANSVSLLVTNGAAITNAITVSSSIGGTAVIGYEGGANGTFDGPIVLQHNLTIYTTNATTSYSLLMQGGITGTGNVTITGGGTVKWQNNVAAGFTNPFAFAGNLYLTPGTNPAPALNTTYLGINDVISNTVNISVAANTVLADINSAPFNVLSGAGWVEPGIGAAYSPTVIIGSTGGSGTFSGSFTTNSGGYSCALIKNGAGTETFTGDNSVSTGNTTINAGTLAVNNTTGYGLGVGGVGVGTNGTLAGTGIIYAASNSTFSITGVISVGNAGDTTGQTFTLTNTAGLYINSGGALNVDLFSGAGAGNNTGTAAAADILIAQCPVTLRTNSILNVGNPKNLTAWAVGDKWKIASWNSTPTNGFSTFNLPTLPSNLAWDTSSLYSAGVIGIVAGGPTKAASILGSSIIGTDFIISGTNLNGGASFHYAVLTTTNLAIPLTNWMVLTTNSFNADGSFTFTNAINATQPQKFFDVRAVQ